MERSSHTKNNKTNFDVYSTRKKIINIWNSIPTELKHSVSINVFFKKGKLKRLIDMAVIDCISVNMNSSCFFVGLVLFLFVCLFFSHAR